MKTTRREFLKALPAAIVASRLPFPRRGRAVAATATNPNLVVILADDLGRECLGSYGGLSYQTPHLDSLAASGMRFTHCFSTPLCAPSRNEILTGRYPVKNYRGWGRFEPEQDRTFGQLLRESGYATAAAGKWQMCLWTHQKDMDHPQRSGFDESSLWTWYFDDGKTAETRPKYWGPWVVQNQLLRRFRNHEYGPDVFTNFLVDFIARNRNDRFLAYYPMLLPHKPFEPTPQSGTVLRLGQHLPARLRNMLWPRYFADYVSYMDVCVGRLVGELDRLGLRENTLILFLADNGTVSDIESTTRDGTTRGGKGMLNEPGTRVPLIASWPGSVAGGSVCDDLVDLSDVLPTLVEASGSRVALPADLDGRSFLPQLLGRASTPREWVYISHWGFTDGRYARAVRGPRWKLYGDGRLYDLERDPLERGPIDPAGEGPEATRERARLQQVIEEIESGVEPYQETTTGKTT